MLGGLALLNERFKLTHQEAQAIWENSYRDISLPDYVYKAADDTLTIRKWNKEENVINQDIDVEELCHITETELTRLQTLGINVITHALTPADEDRIWVATPWVDKMEPCTPQMFLGRIRPCLVEYFKQYAALYDPENEVKTPPYLWDPVNRRNYSEISASDGGSIAFLHDVEPYISRNAAEALTYLQELGEVALGQI